jgi:hypothetical protein
MLVETWTPGFIPDLVKAGQILLGLGVGLILGYVEKTSLKNISVLNRIKSKEGICLFAVAVGVAIALFQPSFITPKYLSGTVLIFILLTGGALAANVKNKSVLVGLSWASFLVLGLSSVPSQGSFPDNLGVITVNILGLVLLSGGAAALSHWAMLRQNRLWPQVGIRILGAWLVAISLMMLAFQQSGVSF